MELGMLSLYVMLMTCFTVTLVVTKIPEDNLSGGNICLTLILRGGRHDGEGMSSQENL